ncbi:hypothetical protein [Pseudomonas proteolytica]|uniref:hypothetical protein n=1 Tax=Pseudomonas proteolytica TaxID=219574 RepID=UPI0030D87021
MPEEKVVMYESPQAASIQTVTGWVGDDGRFWGKDEHMARWCGATHRQCEKNPEHPIHAIRSYCQKCHDESRKAKFAAMPVREWSGEPLVIFDGDQYFFDEDSLRDFLVDSDIDLADLQLCICEPNMPREIDPSDVFSDDLPEDGEIRDQQLVAAFELLNEMIRQSEPLSWSEGEYAASLPQSLLDEIATARVTP